MIGRIDPVSISKICSGQVVVDLSSAVKELIENCLDAKATLVEINLTDMGSASIEVSDNGIGIANSNYSSVALKHHTSKLTDFTDLDGISTFGFRGEALNALCELSANFVVSTKQVDQDVGNTLKYSSSGR